MISSRVLKNQPLQMVSGLSKLNSAGNKSQTTRGTRTYLSPVEFYTLVRDKMLVRGYRFLSVVSEHIFFAASDCIRNVFSTKPYQCDHGLHTQVFRATNIFTNAHKSPMLRFVCFICHATGASLRCSASHDKLAERALCHGHRYNAYEYTSSWSCEIYALYLVRLITTDTFRFLQLMENPYHFCYHLRATNILTDAYKSPVLRFVCFLCRGVTPLAERPAVHTASYLLHIASPRAPQESIEHAVPHACSPQVQYHTPAHRKRHTRRVYELVVTRNLCIVPRSPHHDRCLPLPVHRERYTR